MKPYERRAVGAYPYYILATWNPRLACWQDPKSGRPYPTVEEAVASVGTKPGKYRIAMVNEYGRVDLEPFEIKKG